MLFKTRKKRKLFCELSPITYKISCEKEILKRKIQDRRNKVKFVSEKQEEKLEYSIIKHNSLIRRKLNNVDINLQENKAVSLSIAAPKINNIIIKPGQTFSFWELVGRCTKKKGYLEGVTITGAIPTKGIGGGMCQFTNLLHWMVLHTNLDIIEHHHHNHIDLFPDFNRKIPFGTGTSIVYNYLDYRFKNNTDTTFQIIVYTTDEYLKGEIRADKQLPIKIHIVEEESFYYEKQNELYRHNKIYRKVIDKRTGNTIENKMILENNAKTMYSKEFIDQGKIKKNYIEL